MGDSSLETPSERSREMNDRMMLTEEDEAVLLQEPIIESEEARLIRSWRAEQFGRLGFEPNDAAGLAASAADLNDARQLMASGCPLETAAAILL
jgi:hypothetical protein